MVTRAQRQAQTRSELLAAAREVFLAEGYDGASVARIAEAAGYTTGAIYANFGGKDELLFAVLDARAQGSRRAQAEAALGEETFEASIRAAARVLLPDDEDPRWARLIAAYWARAAQDEAFRARAADRAAAVLDGVTEVVAEVARRHAMRPVISPREIARGAGALVRGIRLERALGFAGDHTSETFEAMFLAYVRGLMRPQEGPR
jgi:AcrR family transcriptional regulator